MEVEVGGKKYRTGKLHCRDQFHVSRRLMPLLVARLDGLRQLSVMFGVPGAAEAAKEADAQKTPEQLAEQQEALAADSALVASYMPIANALARMPEADVDYVLDKCLAVCVRVESAGLAPVFSNGQIMATDLDMPGMMKLVKAVVEENCGNFFPDPPVSEKSS